jgi:hypothetical protein
MPDAPDNYQYLGTSDRVVLSDLGELAARLGSVYTFDRGGNVILIVTGDNGLSALKPTLSGTGADYSIVADPTLHSPYSFQLTGGSSGNRFSSVTKWLPLSEKNIWGLYASVAFPGEFEDFRMILSLRAGEEVYNAIIEISRDDNQLYYYDVDGDLTLIAGVDIPIDDGTFFNHFKLVADFGTFKYVRFIFNDIEYDLSGIPFFNHDATEIGQSGSDFFSPSVSSVEYAVAQLTLVSRSGQNDTAIVNSIVYTIGEAERSVE